jgi:hypothetical protein
MLRNLVALMLTFVVGIMGIVQPAYAMTNPEIGNNVYVNNSFNLTQEHENLALSFIESVGKGATTTVGVAVGGLIACYAIDGVATVFFPPAAALSAFCPAIGATSGGTTAIMESGVLMAKAR